MVNSMHVLTCCLSASLLLLAGCGGEEEPPTAVPQEEPTAAPTETVPAPEAGSPDTLAYTFEEGTELIAFEGRPSLKNPILVAIDEGFRWGALVGVQGQTMWVVDGETTSLGDEEISDFAVSADLSRFAYRSNDVVAVDGKEVGHGQTSCCPVFSEDGSSVGYIADGSFVVLDSVPHERMGDAAEQLTLSADGSRHAYIVDGNAVVLDGEKQKAYDRVAALTFSPDGSSFAYLANDDLLVVEGKETEIEENTAGQVAFSPDGSQMAYVKGELKSGRVVVGNKVQQRYSFGCPEVFLKWSCITFTSDGSSVAYTAPLLSVAAGPYRLSYRVVRDGAQDRPFIGCCLVASPKGSHIAYVSSLFKVLVDGQELESVAASLTPSRLVFAYENRLDLPGGLLAADLVFTANSENLGFLLYETGLDPASITKLHLEVLDVP